MQSAILTNYTKQVRDGLVVGPNVHVIPHAILGLCEEAGEVAGVFKKSQYLGNRMDFDRITEELGDVLWYLTFLADLLGLSLEDLAKLNIKKLAQRRPALYTEIGDGDVTERYEADAWVAARIAAIAASTPTRGSDE